LQQLSLLNRLQAALGLCVSDASVLAQRNPAYFFTPIKDNRPVLYVCASPYNKVGLNIPAHANAIATLVRQVG